MTKEQLLKSLEGIPDDFEVSISILDSYGVCTDTSIVLVENKPEFQTVFLHVEDN